MNFENKKLFQEFFSKQADVVAKKLLGKILCCKLEDGKVLRSKIVETEAYFDEKDPASRASKGKNKVSEMMSQEPGKILIYNVHKYLMLNFVTGKNKQASAVLIRAVEPLNFSKRCCGPGLLTESLKINKSNLHGMKCFIPESQLWVEDSFKKVSEKEIGRSFRIGVSKDLEERHRHFIKDSKFVSRRKNEK